MEKDSLVMKNIEFDRTNHFTALTIQITPEFLLIAAIMMEIPIAMIVLSRVLKYKINGWANIIAGLITIAFVVGMGALTPHYIFIAAMEDVGMLFIIWFAWKWTNPEVKAE